MKHYVYGLSKSDDEYYVEGPFKTYRAAADTAEFGDYSFAKILVEATPTNQYGAPLYPWGNGDETSGD